jgi:hypothetical protein
VGIKSGREHHAEPRNTDRSLCSTRSKCKEQTQYVPLRRYCTVDISQARVEMPRSSTLLGLGATLRQPGQTSCIS